MTWVSISQRYTEICAQDAPGAVNKHSIERVLVVRCPFIEQVNQPQVSGHRRQNGILELIERHGLQLIEKSLKSDEFGLCYRPFLLKTKCDLRFGRHPDGTTLRTIDVGNVKLFGVDQVSLLEPPAFSF